MKAPGALKLSISLDLIEQLLREALKIREDVRVAAVVQDANDVLTRNVTVILEGESLPERIPGVSPPEYLDGYEHCLPASRWKAT